MLIDTMNIIISASSIQNMLLHETLPLYNKGQGILSLLISIIMNRTNIFIFFVFGHTPVLMCPEFSFL